MGTRGFVGFVVDDVEKIAYNHYDSYPSGTGVEVLNWLKVALTAGVDQLAQHVRALTVVDDVWEVESDRIVPTPPIPTGAELERLRQWSDGNVGGTIAEPADGTVRNWYQALRRTQGSPGDILDAGYIIDGHGFPFDGLFCEWGYLVDLDARTFEVYRGFGSEPPRRGRWARPDKLAEAIERRQSESRPTGYDAVELLASWPLSEALPDDDEFLQRTEKVVYGEDEDDD